MDSQSTPVVSATKLPILNPNEFDFWKMRIEQYFLMTDYSLWEVIISGDSPTPIVVIEGVVRSATILSADQKLARKNELKAHGTLLMALPDKHQLKFNSHKDAKTLMQAIEKHFGGNTVTKKVQKTLLKQQFKNFTGSSSEDLDQIRDRLQKLVSQLEIHGTGRNLGDNRVTTMGFDMSKVECYNHHRKGHFTQEYRSPKDTRRTGAAEPQRRHVPVETSTSNALVSQCDGIGSYDWSYQAEEEPANFALMAISSSSSAFDNELSPAKPAQDISYVTIPMSPIIKDWVSESEDESKPNDPLSAPSFVQTSEHVKPSGHSVQPIEAPILVATPKPTSSKTNGSVLTKSKTVSVTAARPVSVVVPKIMVTKPRHARSLNTKSNSTIRRHKTRSQSSKTSNTSPKVTATKAQVVSAAKRKKRKWGNPQALKDKGVIDNGCSWHMTENMSYLSDFQELNGKQNKEGDAAFDGKEHDAEKPESVVNLFPSSSALSREQDDMIKKKDKGKSPVKYLTGNRDFNADFEDYSEDISNNVSAAGPIVPTVGQNYSNSTNPISDAEKEDFTYYDHENVGTEADFNNLETSITVSPIPTTRTHKDHPVAQIIGDLSLTTQTRRFEDPDHPDKVYKVVKALYGLHQAPRAWYETLANYLLENGFHRGQIDQSLFTKKQKGDILLVQIYVDDIIFGATNKDLCKSFEKLMKDKFQMSSIGELTFFLGLQINDGSLMYLTSSRPDIMFAVCACARFQVTPKVSHLHAVKRIFRYLKGKPHLGLWYPKDSPFDLVAYSDSDYAGASLDRKSTTRGCQFLGYRLISWQCKKQTVVATSSTEAEYVADQTVSGKDNSNPLMADNLPKIVWYSTHHVTLNKELASPKANGSCKSDASEGFNQIIDFLNGSYIAYALTVNPTIYVSCIKQFWNTVAVKQSNDVTRLQALVDKKKVVVTEATIRDALHLDDAEGVDCLPNEEIFTALARMGYEKPSTKLTFYKAFFSSQWKRVGKGCSRVDTPLFKGMLVAREPEEQGDAEEQSNDDNAAEEPVTTIDDVAQNLGITKLKTRVKKLERANKVKTLKLRRLRKVGTSQRIESSDDTIIEDVSNQGRVIDELDKDESAALMNEKEETEEVKDITGDAQVEGRQAKIYQIDMDHAAKVLSMQEDELEIQEAVEVVTTAKLITEVVAAVSETVSAAAVVPAVVTAAPVKVVVPFTRRRRGVVIRDPEEESSAKNPTKTKSKDNGKAMDHVKQKAKENLYVQRYQTIKKRPQTEAQARRNMMMYLKNTVDFKMDYFKGMSYDDIRPIFKAKFNSNIKFILKTKEQIQEKENREIASINETPAQKAAKRRRLNEEAEDVEELKQHLEIVLDEYDDVYIEATLLARKAPVSRKDSLTSKPKNFSDDFLLITLKAMFGRPDGQDQVWMNQRSVYGQEKIKSWKLLESCRVHIVALTTTQLIMLVERRYTLSRFTLDQMLNTVRLRLEEQSEMSLELIRFTRQQLQEGQHN
uniref:Uncharacterized mitochondrial protein AtMg00810-like n=1 Tax=Tanacetum cinerariifolium TaxID=118510 RepID=A0A6L2JLY3_TANCI|nr:uncharacterized mitochondrial protein AtMg00810-like [Tanacetum cinerariifolium]